MTSALHSLAGPVPARAVDGREHAVRRSADALTQGGGSDAARRTVDCLLAAVVLLVLLVGPGALAAVLLCRRPSALQRLPRVGRHGRLFRALSLAPPPGLLGQLVRRTGGHRLPALLNVLRGDMALVGPRPAAPGELDPSDPRVRRRLEVRPGLLSLWWLRRRASIAYDDELSVDAEYAAGRSLRGDLGILLRAGLSLLYGRPGQAADGRIFILGAPVDNLTMAEAVGSVVQRLQRSGASQVCFVNADCLNIACRTPEYRRALGRADLCLADGVGMRLAGRLLRRPVRQNVNGTDLVPRLCRALAAQGAGLYLLGARAGVAQAAAERMARTCPGLRICGVQHGYFGAHETADVVARIAASRADVLLVAMGAPRQDLWIHAHLDRLGVKVAMGVGGLFDFCSGRVPRAPLWMREIGLEWFYRFLQEPRRMWRRYFVGNAVFLLRVLLERLAGSTWGGAPRRSLPRSAATL